MMKLELIGNLGADIQKKMYNGETYYSLNVAHTKKIVNKESGEVKSSTTWVSCTINWEIGGALQYLVKGAKVYVRGDATLRLFVGHDGQQHCGVNLRVSELEICEYKTNLNQNENNDDRF